MHALLVPACCRASLVQSRIKALSRLPMIQEIAEDPALRFKFKEPEKVSAPMLQLVDVTFKYPKRVERVPQRPEEGGLDVAGAERELLIVEDCNLNVDMDSRIAVSIVYSLCGV